MTRAGTLLQVRDQLLRRPSHINARAAAISILTQRYKCEPHEAEKRLNELKGDNVINALFKAVLPWHYRKALRSHSRLSLAEQFFNLLKFPINDIWLTEIADEGEDPASFYIPIYSMNPGVASGDYDFEQLPLVFQIAVLIYRPKNSYWELHADDGQEAWQYLVDTYKLDAALRPTGAISMQSLMQLFKKQRGPLHHIPLAINVTDYNTGTIFFDFDYEMGDPNIDWSKENIEWLRKQYKVALSIEKKLYSLNDWLLAHPRERITQVCRLYNQLRKL